jgi:hypothetical protein
MYYKVRWMVPRLAAYGFFQQFYSGFEVCWWYTPAVGRPPPLPHSRHVVAGVLQHGCCVSFLCGAGSTQH